MAYICKCPVTIVRIDLNACTPAIQKIHLSYLRLLFHGSTPGPCGSLFSWIVYISFRFPRNYYDMFIETFHQARSST